MTTRRDFLKGGLAAGIVFCGCGMVHNASAQTPRQKLPVSVNGKRIKTIDVHAHCHFREVTPLLGDGQPPRNCRRSTMRRPPSSKSRSDWPRWTSRRSTWRCCRSIRSGMAASAIWLRQIVKIQNEKLAELCASKPDRFAAFASLTLQAPDLAVQELETAVKKQGLKGAAIGDIVAGRSSPTRNSTPSGPRRKNSASPCSSIP